MSAALKQMAARYAEAAAANPLRARQILLGAATDIAGYAQDPRNGRIAPQLLALATRFAQASQRPATALDFGDLLHETAQAYNEVGHFYDDMGLLARRNEIHEERTPGLPRVSITPKSVNRSTRLGDQATVKWQPTDEDINANIRQTNTIAFWQGEKEESQAVTVDTAILDQPREANSQGGPRPYQVVSFGSDGAIVNVRMDVGQRVTVVGSFVSVLVGLNPPRTDFAKGQLTIGASMGFFAAPSVAPVICTEYVDDLDGGGTPSALIPRPTKAMYLQPMQSSLDSGTATITFYALDGAVPQYVTPWINGAQNVPIPLTADIAFIQVTNTGPGAANFRLPFQLGM